MINGVIRAQSQTLGRFWTSEAKRSNRAPRETSNRYLCATRKTPTAVQAANARASPRGHLIGLDGVIDVHSTPVPAASGMTADIGSPVYCWGGPTHCVR